MNNDVYGSIDDSEYVSSFFANMINQIRVGKHSKIDFFDKNVSYLLGNIGEQENSILDSKNSAPKVSTIGGIFPNYKLSRTCLAVAALPIMFTGGLLLFESTAVVGASLDSSIASEAIPEFQQMISSFLPAGITITGISSALAVLFSRKNTDSKSHSNMQKDLINKSEKIEKVKNSFDYLYQRLYEEGQMPSLNQIPLYSLLYFTDISGNDPEFNINLLSLMVDYGKAFEKNQNTRPFERTDDSSIINNRVINYISSNSSKASPAFLNSPYVNLLLCTGNVPMPESAENSYNESVFRGF